VVDADKVYKKKLFYLYVLQNKNLECFLKVLGSGVGVDKVYP